MKKTLWKIFISFAITRLKIGLIEKCEKTTLVLYKTASSDPRGIPNIFKSRCYQNLSNTVYRIEFGLVEKKIKFDN